MNFASGFSLNAPVEVTGPNQVLTIRLRAFPLLMPVMTERFDPVDHIISVVTLLGHPLAGWRYRHVYSIGTNDVVVETGGYDQPAPGIFSYAVYFIFEGTVKRSWMEYLEYIQKALGVSQGTHLTTSLGDKRLGDLRPRQRTSPQRLLGLLRSFHELHSQPCVPIDSLQLAKLG